ncbi:MAG: lipoyl synthase [Myxococcales bacterium]|nr:lipoyl synthase [Myxococcales bacterium]
MMASKEPKPPWLKVRLAGGEKVSELRAMFRALDLKTVCEEARCPNQGECWQGGTATLMILGDTCTRGCRFCAVKTGDPQGYRDPREPEHVARALAKMDLAYVVLTMVDRDDLRDGGASHVAESVQRIRRYSPELLVEVLTGDFAGSRHDVETVVRDGQPDVFAHNVEVVPSLQRRMRDARCSWERSIDVLRWATASGAKITKSSLMVGCGETEKEMDVAMALLRDAGVDVLTIGQYLRPSAKHAPLERYATPDEFERYRTRAMSLGFSYVASGPLVRSSYRAAEAFLHGALGGRATPHSDRYGKKRLEVLV